MFRIVLTGLAQQDIQSAHDWWAENHSPTDAHRWYLGIYQAITSLANMPERCPLTPESDLLKQGIRQLNFGIGQRCTHRIVFAITDTEVLILRVRHASQETLQVFDLRFED